jgi:hypothetical protein
LLDRCDTDTVIPIGTPEYDFRCLVFVGLLVRIPRKRESGINRGTVSDQIDLMVRADMEDERHVGEVSGVWRM